MKKFMALACAVVLAVAALAACTGNNNAEEPTEVATNVTEAATSVVETATDATELATDAE